MREPRPPAPLGRFASGAAGERPLDEFVAVDLETTGLDAARDRIIEIGATRFRRDGAGESFSTFVDPRRPIPPEISELTGIVDADVAGAPTVTRATAELAAFIGPRPVVGQNVAFDLAFLAAAEVRPPGPAFDTYDLASVLLPTAPRLNLGSLARALDVDTGAAHRALADAEAARDVFLRLLERLEALPRALLLDLHAIAASAGWSLERLIADALTHVAERTDGIDGIDGAERAEGAESAASAPAVTSAPLRPRDPASAVTAGDVDALFEAAAARPELIERFERREGQAEMARAVASNIAHAGHLAVEAGTGTGKSLAYLLPSLLHALRNGDRVVISTQTLNLQEQLAQRDIPAAAALVESHEGASAGSLVAAVLKGRANYLCLERWEQARATAQPRTIEQARMHARVAVWLSQTESGDVAELYLRGEQRAAWDDLSAEGTDCLARRCPPVRDGICFLLRARQRAAAAHAVVVNHALLLADAASDGDVLPPFRHLIVDEAQRLEDVATQRYGASLSLRDLASLLDEIASGGGVTGVLRAAAAAGPSALSPAAGLTADADAVAEAARRARERVPTLADALRAYAEERAEGEGAGEGELALGSGRQSQPAWADVEESAVELDVTLHHLGERLRRARDAAGAIAEGVAPGVERLPAELARAADAMAAARSTLGDVALRGDPSLIAWLRVSEADVQLNVAPLEVAARLAEDLYAGCESVTVTSATLTEGGSFAFSVRRLGLLDPDTLRVESPFDYRRAALTLVVEDAPPPGAAGYADAVHRALGDAAVAAGGRTLALFTSHAALRAAAGALRAPLRAEGITVLAQGLDGPPGRLLRALAERPRTLLLGTAAFWEGVDLRGEALSQIAIARLPFPVPTEPVHAGRAAQYEVPFKDYMLPQAVLRFRQGFGRLIRDSRDRGVFLVLDSRILSRRYGDVFLDALPDCEVRRLAGPRVAEAVGGWLAR